MKSENGFTLIEIMIVIAILGILAAAGSLAYDSQKRKGYRSDAISSITLTAQKLENWRASNGLYSSDINDVSPTGSATSREGKYTLSLSNISSETYTITATATGHQTADTDCRKFILTHTGKKTAEKDDTTANTKCWPK